MNGQLIIGPNKDNHVLSLQRKRSASESLKLRRPISSACERQTFLLTHRRWGTRETSPAAWSGEKRLFLQAAIS